MHIKRAASAIVIVTFLLALTGCRKDLCYDHYRSIAVNLDWELEWERDYGAHNSEGWDSGINGYYDDLRPSVPEGVTMLRYSANTHEPARMFFGNKGGESVVDEGTFGLLFYNNDTEYIVLSDEASLASARATTTGRSRASLADMHPGERTISPADELFGSFEDNIPALDIHEHRALPVKMQPLVFTYIIRFNFEYGSHHVALARGAMAGLAESVYLRNGVTSEESATVLFDCQLDGDCAVAQFGSFGAPGFPDEYYGRAPETREWRLYTLNLEVRLTSGQTKTMLFDISDQMLAQPRGGVITVGGIRIEDDENVGGNSAFDVSVTDWGEDEDVTLPLTPN